MEIVTANVAGKARETTYHGRKYLVAPMTLIVPGVLNGSQGPLYYPLEEVRKDPQAWNHIPIVVYHPMKNGRPVSARRPEILDKSGIGHLFNSHANGKLTAEGWFDVERTRAVDPRVLATLETNTPMELSTGLTLEQEPAPQGAVYNSPGGPRPYVAIARNYRPDHLAILPDQKGACAVLDGCGVLINRTRTTDYELAPLWVRNLRLVRKGKGWATQPRKPAGTPEGGEWASQSGGAQASGGAGASSGPDRRLSEVPSKTNKDGTVVYAGVHEKDWLVWAYESDNINIALRGQSLKGERNASDGTLVTDEDAKEYRRVGQKIQAAASKYGTEQQVLYRGVSFASEAEADTALKPGLEIKAPGLLSTTPSRVSALEYAKSADVEEAAYRVPVILEYRSNSGHKGVYTAPFGVVPDPHTPPADGEFVFPKGATYRVAQTSVGADGIRHVVLTPPGQEFKPETAAKASQVSGPASLPPGVHKGKGGSYYTYGVVGGKFKKIPWKPGQPVVHTLRSETSPIARRSSYFQGLVLLTNAGKNQPRVPAGSSKGGQFAPKAGEAAAPTSGRHDKVAGTDYSRHELAEAALKAGHELFGKELVFDQIKSVKSIKLSALQKKSEEEGGYVDEYEYVFKPSTGKGIDASSTPWKEARADWADKDGKIYTVYGGAIHVITPDVPLHSGKKKDTGPGPAKAGEGKFKEGDDILVPGEATRINRGKPVRGEIQHAVVDASQGGVVYRVHPYDAKGQTDPERFTWIPEKHIMVVPPGTPKTLGVAQAKKLLKTRNEASVWELVANRLLMPLPFQHLRLLANASGQHRL